MAVIGPGLVYFLSVSSNVGLQYFRYLLVCFPFLFVFCGRLGPVLERGSWVLRGVVCCLLLSIPISVLPHHPYYLPYFNEAVGGPEGGPKHLADSSIDWGEGLLALRDWLGTHRPGERAKLAYFGTMAPQVAGFENFELPPFGPGFEKRSSQASTGVENQAPEVGPVPGLQAVSVNYILGISFPAPSGRNLQGLVHVPQGAYSYLAKFQPIAKPGYSMWVFDLSVEDVNRVRAELGMPEWRAADVVQEER